MAESSVETKIMANESYVLCEMAMQEMECISIDNVDIELYDFGNIIIKIKPYLCR